MKRFIMNVQPSIPPERMDDVKELKRFIEEEMKIIITYADTYLLWEDISDSWCASWLDIETHYTDMTREEFLLDEMRKRGYFKEI